MKYGKHVPIPVHNTNNNLIRKKYCGGRCCADGFGIQTASLLCRPDGSIFPVIVLGSDKAMVTPRAVVEQKPGHVQAFRATGTV